MESVLPVFAALLTPLAGLAGYIAYMYRERIKELQAELAECERREKRVLGVILAGSSDEAKLASALARVITEGNGE
jgi:hypothetical protein